MSSRRLRREIKRRKAAVAKGYPYRFDENKLIYLIEELKEWKEMIDHPSDDFLSDFQDLFSLVATALSSWSANPQDEKSNSKAEMIADALTELYKKLGDLAPSNLNAFGRDVFDIGKFHVEVAQYFRGANYYADDASIKKLVRWSVFHGKSVIMRYYLERSEFVLPCYILGLQSRADKKHTQVQMYGPSRPSYAKLKTDVLNDLSARMHDTIHQLKADEGAVKSTPHGLISPRPSGQLPEEESASERRSARKRVPSFSHLHRPLDRPGSTRTPRSPPSSSRRHSSGDDHSYHRNNSKHRLRDSGNSGNLTDRSTTETHIKAQVEQKPLAAAAKKGKNGTQKDHRAASATEDGEVLSGEEGAVNVLSGKDGKVSYLLDDGTEVVVGDTARSGSASSGSKGIIHESSEEGYSSATASNES